MGGRGGWYIHAFMEAERERLKRQKKADLIFYGSLLVIVALLIAALGIWGRH